MAYCAECTYLDLSSADLYGKFWCEKKLERHAANELECYRFCRDYNRDSIVAKSAYDYSYENSKSGCYLTTMICNILKLSDNNIYLETLRNFRNKFLQKNEKYKLLLVEYDIIGPKIADSLNTDPLKEKIAKECFNKYIIPIVYLLNDCEYENAIEYYLNMTNKLRDLYNLNNQSIQEIQIKEADINKSGHGKYIKRTIY